MDWSGDAMQNGQWGPKEAAGDQGQLQYCGGEIATRLLLHPIFTGGGKVSGNSVTCPRPHGYQEADTGFPSSKNMQDAKGRRRL